MHQIQNTRNAMPSIDQRAADWQAGTADLQSCLDTATPAHLKCGKQDPAGNCTLVSRGAATLPSWNPVNAFCKHASRRNHKDFAASMLSLGVSASSHFFQRHVTFEGDGHLYLAYEQQLTWAGESMAFSPAKVMTRHLEHAADAL